MALIPETGAGVANADTYATEAEFVTFAGQRGVTLTTGVAEGLLRTAMSRLANLDYIGYRVARDQSLDWPRADVCIDGFSYASTELPAHLKKAQMALAWAARSTELQPVVAADARGAVIEKTVGPLTTRYAERRELLSKARVPEADGYLAKLLRSGAGHTFRIQRA